jgi:asparagine synthase (glutamine-hydrolysing)
MCGIAGFIGGHTFGSNKASTQIALEGMTSQLIHRGPDDSGIWIDFECKIAFGHRRLSILDLSQNGHQPMMSQSGRYVVVFNGEIYNHADIRKRIAISYRGGTDTEVLLAGFDAWGVEETLHKIDGMFALAVWDKMQRKLTLARDRVGEKPLYYGWQGYGRDKVFLFGSELKALKAYPNFQGHISTSSVQLYLKYNNIPGPYSIYEGIYKLGPGEFATLRIGDGSLNIHKYWKLSNVIDAGLASQFSGSATEASSQLESILTRAIKSQMMGDVPVGLFLSGGIDSSLVAALAQKERVSPIKSFAIGFAEKEYNEAGYAKAVAGHLKTDHHELYVSPADAMSVIPTLSKVYDEPFSDSSQIPMLLVSRLAKTKVTIALSGDGGDELFGGYNRYRANFGILKSFRLMPIGARKILAKAITNISTDTWNAVAKNTICHLPISMRYSNIGEKMHKIAIFIASNSSIDAYDSLVSNWVNPREMMLKGELPSKFIPEINALGLSDAEIMMAMDMLNYLPNDILTKVDRASMSSSLEVRAPFLDRQVIDFAWRLPIAMKINGSNTKWILRDILKRYVPNELIDRPKMGFGIPLGDWLRGPLKIWAEDLLMEKKLNEHGLFSAKEIKALWDDHISRKSGLQNKLWSILMFQSWIETQSSGSPKVN